MNMKEAVKFNGNSMMNANLILKESGLAVRFVFTGMMFSVGGENTRVVATPLKLKNRKAEKEALAHLHEAAEIINKSAAKDGWWQPKKKAVKK
jgi:hypothetical protein